jgi:glucose 1-dehydrogenase
MRLASRVALVTGGGASIGLGIAEELAKEGADVAIVDIDAQRAKAGAAAVQGLGRRGVAIHADVSKRADVKAMLDQCIRELGTLDILVNNAAITRNKPFFELDDATWDLVLNTNLRSVYMGTQEAARYWVGKDIKGKVINITSIDQIQAFPGNVDYCVSKAGADMFTKATSLALAPHGITINCVAPGLTESGMLSSPMSDPKWVAGVPVKVPLGRLAKPSDIGRAVVYLASSDGDYLTGTTIFVDGGHVISAAAAIQKMYAPATRA